MDSRLFKLAALMAKYDAALLTKLAARFDRRDAVKPYKLSSNKSGIDWNNAGGNDDAQDYYDSEEASHVAAADFGPTWDFELENHITKWVFTPVSNAALQWCYAHLPEDCPRYGARGFLIEAEHIKGVIGGARRDNLMSPEDYEAAMQERDLIAHQRWDDEL